MKVDSGGSKAQAPKSEAPKAEGKAGASKSDTSKASASQEKPAAPEAPKSAPEYGGQSTFKASASASGKASTSGSKPTPGAAGGAQASSSASQANTAKGVAGAASATGSSGLGTASGAVGSTATGGYDKAAGVLGAAAEVGQAAGALPTPIDQTNVTPIDKAIIKGLGLENLPPGGKTELEVELTAELSAIVGGEVGAMVNLSIERGKENTNEYVLGIGGGASLEGELTGDTTGGKLNGKVGGEVTAGIELTVDLSKPGAATELAGFAAHTGLMAASPTAAGALAAIERIPGVNLPGEPAQFIRNHLSAIEVGASGKLTPELGLVVGAGVNASAEAYLKGGGRIDFNKDGTLTLSTNAAVGGELSLEGSGGLAGFNANVTVGGVNAEMGIETAITVQPGVPPQELGRTYTAEFTLGGSALGAGTEATIRVDLGSTLAQVPADVRNRMNAALASGNGQEAANIFRNEILPHTSVTGTMELNSTVSLAGGLEAVPKVGGTGGGVGLNGSVTTTIPVGSASVTLDADSVNLAGSLYGNEVSTDVTYQQLLEMTRRAAA